MRTRLLVHYSGGQPQRPQNNEILRILLQRDEMSKKLILSFQMSVCILMRERQKGLDLDGQGREEYIGAVGREETIVRYYTKKIFSINYFCYEKKGKKKSKPILLKELSQAHTYVCIIYSKYFINTYIEISCPKYTKNYLGSIIESSI